MRDRKADVETKGTPPFRFVGGNRGLRHVFGRVWWRAYVLGMRNAEPPTPFVELMGEDELVQIMERPGIAGHRRLARQVGDSFLEGTERYRAVTRSDLMRDGMKRIRRAAGLLSLEALDDDELVMLVDEAFEAAGRFLSE